MALSKLIVAVVLVGVASTACGRARYREEGDGVYDEKLGLLWTSQRVSNLDATGADRVCRESGARLPTYSSPRGISVDVGESAFGGDFDCFGYDWDCERYEYGADDLVVDELGLDGEGSYSSSPRFYANRTNQLTLADGSVVEAGLVLATFKRGNAVDPARLNGNPCGETDEGVFVACDAVGLVVCARETEVDTPFGAF